MGTTYNIGGKTFNSIDEWVASEKNNPESDTVFWDYQKGLTRTIIGGKCLTVSGEGKCTYKCKTYEGKIENRDGWLYVGGEKVRYEG